MRIEKDYQCRACNYFFSHPVDVCPICGDQFYWLLVAADPPSRDQTLDFIVQMEHVVQGRVTREFITHNNQLWLPPNYWNFEPEGEALKRIPWVAEIRLYQHVAPEKEPSPWETNPGMKLDLPLVSTPAEPSEAMARAAPPPEAPQPAAAAAPQSNAADGRGWGVFYAPLMVFLFLIFLAGAFMVLQYHRVASAPSQIEVPSDE